MYAASTLQDRLHNFVTAAQWHCVYIAEEDGGKSALLAEQQKKNKTADRTQADIEKLLQRAIK